MIGQDKLISKIGSYSDFNSFPKSILVVGKKGSGKHLVCDYISDKFNIESIEVDNKINDEFIDNAYLEVFSKLYIIDLSKINDKDSNTILKFVEEPPNLAIICILCEREDWVLPTIYNRCQVFKLEEYSKEVLKNFTNNNIVLNICETPGEVLECESYNFEEMCNLTKTIIEQIHIASYANVLVLSDKISYNDKEDGYKLNIFVKVLLNTIYEYIKLGKCKVSIYELTSKLKSDLSIRGINQRHLYEHYLFELKNLVKDGH